VKCDLHIPLVLGTGVRIILSAVECTWD